MNVTSFFDPDTYTLTYIVHENNQALVIDPVWNFDQASGKLSETSIDTLCEYFKEHNLKPVLCIETHAHADHLSGAFPLRERFPEMKIGISKRITAVQEVFGELFHWDESIKRDGSQFDLLFEDHVVIHYAGLDIKILPTPGHTPACSAILIKDCVFTGDTIFMPDYGCGRCDFPKGSAELLYDSIHKELYTLPDSTKMYVGHDYQPNGRKLEFETTIAEQKKHNVQIPQARSREEFVKFRTERDAGLKAPKLLLPSIQVNAIGGQLPKPETNGVSYLKLPITRS